MSRLFKSSNVNLGEPVKISITDEAINFNKNNIKMERSSDMSSDDPSVTASNTISNANFEANEIIESARNEAIRIIDNAKNEIEVERRNVIQKGYDEGFQAGLIDGKRETEDLVQQTLEIKQEIEEEREQLITKIEQEIPKIVIQSIKKILGQEIKVNNEIIINLISLALRKVNSSDVTIKVSQEDFEIVENNKNVILSNNRGISECEIKQDKSLDKGDCIIETECGDVDAGINSQIDRLEEIITEIAGDENAGQ